MSTTWVAGHSVLRGSQIPVVIDGSADWQWLDDLVWAYLEVLPQESGSLDLAKISSLVQVCSVCVCSAHQVEGIIFSWWSIEIKDPEQTTLTHEASVTVMADDIPLAKASHLANPMSLGRIQYLQAEGNSITAQNIIVWPLFTVLHAEFTFCHPSTFKCLIQSLSGLILESPQILTWLLLTKIPTTKWKDKWFAF